MSIFGLSDVTAYSTAWAIQKRYQFIVLYNVRKYIKKSKMRRGKAKMYILSTGVLEGCLLWVANSPAETVKGFLVLMICKMQTNRLSRGRQQAEVKTQLIGMDFSHF